MKKQPSVFSSCKVIEAFNGQIFYFKIHLNFSNKKKRKKLYFSPKKFKFVLQICRDHQ